MKFHYEVHIFFSRRNGYSVFFESDKQLINEHDIISEAIKLNKLEFDLYDSVDYAQSIEEEEYVDAIDR